MSQLEVYKQCFLSYRSKHCNRACYASMRGHSLQAARFPLGSLPCLSPPEGEGGHQPSSRRLRHRQSASRPRQKRPSPSQARTRMIGAGVAIPLHSSSSSSSVALRVASTNRQNRQQQKTHSIRRTYGRRSEGREAGVQAVTTARLSAVVVLGAFSRHGDFSRCNAYRYKSAP